MFDSGFNVVDEVESEEIRTARLFNVVSAVTTAGAALILIFFLIAGSVSNLPSFRYMIGVTVLYFLFSMLSLWMGRRAYLRPAIITFVTNTIVGMYFSLYLFNGTTGPLAIVLVLLPVVAGLLGGRRATYWTAVSVGGIYIVVAGLEIVGFLHPLQVSGLSLTVIYSGLFIITLLMAAIIAGTSLFLTQRALELAESRSDELGQMSRQAEEAARAERNAREREERASRQLRQTVQDYIAFLEQIRIGDYTVRLDIDQLSSPSNDMVTLGQYLNNTVETLVSALGRLQTIQQQYTREQWSTFVERGLGSKDFEYTAVKPSASGSGPAQRAWLPPLDQAMQTKRAVAQDHEMAIPLAVHGEVIGAIGLQRQDSDKWTDEELALAEAIVDQLTQTIESLRLLEETQRQAAREQLTSEITGRIRETLDIETMLQTAIQEMGQALDVAEVEVRMVGKESR